MKLYVKLTAFLCAAIMLLSLFAACAEPGISDTDTEGDTPTQTNASTTQPEETSDPRFDEDGYLKSTLPEDLKFTGETISILFWEDVERAEFEVLENETGLDLVKDAIYSRNVATEERLGVTFEWVGQKGNSNNIKNFVNYVQNCSQNGTFYDIISTYSRTAASLSANSLLEDLNTIDNSYIDLEKPWWPDNMVETCSMNNSLFFISGDISTNLLHMMYAIYYNMDMIKDLGLEDPVKKVDDKTWTIDALIAMTSDLYQDLDSSNSPPATMTATASPRTTSISKPSTRARA